jgi:hypothetical protein
MPAARVSARFDDPNPSSCAGLVRVVALAARGGLESLLGRAPLTGSRTADAAGKVIALIAGGLGGGVQASHPAHDRPGGDLSPSRWDRKRGGGRLGDLGLRDSALLVFVEDRVAVADRGPGGLGDAGDRGGHTRGDPGGHRTRDGVSGLMFNANAVRSTCSAGRPAGTAEFLPSRRARCAG